MCRRTFRLNSKMARGGHFEHRYFSGISGIKMIVETSAFGIYDTHFTCQETFKSIPNRNIYLAIYCVISTEIECEDLGTNVENGIVQYTNSLNVASVRTVKCNAGYKLQDDAPRVCEDSGKWTGGPQICTSEYSSLISPI